MKLLTIIVIIIIVLIIVAIIVHNNQEQIIFRPEKLEENYKFNFKNKFEELWFNVDSVSLNALLFKPNKTNNKLIFYCHGNAGSLKNWGELSDFYLNQGYDFFIFDYRGFGKSKGEIISEAQLHNDTLQIYNQLLQNYKYDKIVIVGYSIGTGIATKLVHTILSFNMLNHNGLTNPNMLVLKSPYYSLESLIKEICPIVPSFLIKYKINTNEFINNILNTSNTIKVLIFHGENDRVIPISHGIKLSQLNKKIELFQLKDCDHLNIIDNKEFQKKLTHYLG